MLDLGNQTARGESWCYHLEPVNGVSLKPQFAHLQSGPILAPIELWGLPHEIIYVEPLAENLHVVTAQQMLLVSVIIICNLPHQVKGKMK